MRKYLSLTIAVLYLFVVAVAVTLREVLVEERKVSVGKEQFCIVIDAGHGGIDGGVTGKTTGIKESDLNLSIALLLKELFSEAGFLVVLTRKTEHGLCEGLNSWTKKGDMAKRRKIIQESNPDFVLSIHQNALAFINSTRGAQVFYRQGKEMDKELALMMQDSLNAIYLNHGVKGRLAMVGEYYMLECTDAPSLIVECGFLSNPEDEKLLQMDSHKKQIASAIFGSVIAVLS